MKQYLAILGFLREPDDAFIRDYMIAATDVKHARTLLQQMTESKHHMLFEVGSIPACWEGYAMEVHFDSDYESVAPLVPVAWLRGVVQSGIIHDITLLDQEEREELYSYFATKLVRTVEPGHADPEELFRYGPYEFSPVFVEDWENLLRLKLTEIEKK
jgi:hypothetical protein